MRGGVGRRAGLRLRIGLLTLIGADRRPAELLGWGPIHAELADTLAATLRSWWCVYTDTTGTLHKVIPIHRRPNSNPGPSPGVPDRLPGEVWIHLDTATLQFLHAAEQAGLIEPGPIRTLLTDITTRLDAAQPGPPNGDPTARHPTAALRRWITIRDLRCTFPGCRTPAHRADIDHTINHAHGGPTTDTTLTSLCRHDHRLRHEGGWTIRHHHPGQISWTSRLGNTYQPRRIDTLRDLPEPRPGATDEDEPEFPEDRLTADPDTCLEPEPEPRPNPPPPMPLYHHFNPPTSHDTSDEEFPF